VSSISFSRVSFYQLAPVNLDAFALEVLYPETFKSIIFYNFVESRRLNERLIVRKIGKI
jgi:hypothetical protein